MKYLIKNKILFGFYIIITSLNTYGQAIYVNPEIIGNTEVFDGEEYTYKLISYYSHLDDLIYYVHIYGGSGLSTEIQSFTIRQEDLDEGVEHPSITIRWNKEDADSNSNQMMLYFDTATPSTGEGDYFEQRINFIEKPPTSTPLSSPLETNQNYVETLQFTESGQKIELNSEFIANHNITYIDGIGRPMQQVALFAGGNQEDIITPITYDGLGRQTKNYLPYAIYSIAAVNQSRIRTEPIQEVHDFYNTEKYNYTKNPYSETVTENSPLGRVIAQFAPGNDWKNNHDINTAHPIKHEYQTNSIRIYEGVKHFLIDLEKIGNTYMPNLVLNSENDG